MGSFSARTAQSHRVNDYEIYLLKLGIPTPITSIGDDSEAFNYEMDEEAETLKKDCSGNVYFSHNPGESGKIMLKLMHPNPNNAVLQTFHSIVTPVGLLPVPGTFDIIINDNQGRPFLRGVKCKIQQQPNGARAKETGSIEWTIICGQLLVNESGIGLETL